jgi:serine/threonine protein kinase
MDPSYFHMLQHSAAPSRNTSPPPSPRKRLAQPVRHVSTSSLDAPAGTEFIGSEPSEPTRASGISSSAFSQGYFKTFFVEERELGRGGKGVVLLVQHMLDGVPLGHFACKRVPVGDDHTWLEKVLVEVQLLQNLSHQNLVSYRHVWLEDYQITTFGPSVPCAFILQQYCNAGDLHHFVLDPARISVTTEQLKERMRRRSKGQVERPTELHEPRRMNFEQIFTFFKDITSGLHHLHSHGYIHRDLKPSNCLLHNTGRELRVLVSDFGEVQVENVARKSTGATGTISYCAPEVLQRRTPGGTFGNFTTKSDVFSLGMIVYFMCFGKLPYSTADVDEEKEDLEQLRAEISSWPGFDDENRVRDDLPDRLYKFLKRLLALNPNDRPSTEDILHGIRAGSGLDDLDATFHPTPNILDELHNRHRISPVESPSPTPRRMSAVGVGTKKGYTRPGPSKLRPESPEKRGREGGPKTTSLEEQEGPVGNGTATASGNGNGTSVIRRKLDKEEQAQISPLSRHNSSPRLALPPPHPPAPLSTLQILASNPTLFNTWRISSFLVKFYTLSKTCHPFVAEPAWIVYPLMLLAALDFVHLGGLWESRIVHGIWKSIALAAVHLCVVFGAARWGLLCPRRVVMGYDDYDLR